MRRQPVGVLGSLALLAALVAVSAAPSAATTFVKETGLLGSYSLMDTNQNPGAICKYGKEVAPNGAWFKWMKVQPPTVYAADRDSNIIDQRMASWQFKVQQRRFDSDGKWTTVASSPIQKATAFENSAAPFTSMRVDWRPPRNGTNSGLKRIRALVIIRFYEPGGDVEGTAKFAVDWYKRKEPWWTPIGNFCQDFVTSG